MRWGSLRPRSPLGRKFCRRRNSSKPKGADRLDLHPRRRRLRPRQARREEDGLPLGEYASPGHASAGSSPGNCCSPRASSIRPAPSPSPRGACAPCASRRGQRPAGRLPRRSRRHRGPHRDNWSPSRAELRPQRRREQVQDRDRGVELSRLGQEPPARTHLRRRPHLDPLLVRRSESSAAGCEAGSSMQTAATAPPKSCGSSSHSPSPRAARGFGPPGRRRTTDLSRARPVRESFEQKSRLGEVWFGLSRGLMHGETHQLILSVTMTRSTCPTRGGSADGAAARPHAGHPGWAGAGSRTASSSSTTSDRVGRRRISRWAGRARFGWRRGRELRLRPRRRGSTSPPSRGFTPGDRQLLLAPPRSADVSSGRHCRRSSLCLRYLFRDFPSQAAPRRRERRPRQAPRCREPAPPLGGDTGLRGYPSALPGGRPARPVDDRAALVRRARVLPPLPPRRRAVRRCRPRLVRGRRPARRPRLAARYRRRAASHRPALRTPTPSVSDIAFPLDGDPSIEKVQYLI